MPRTLARAVNSQYQLLGVKVDALTIETAIAQITAYAGEQKSPACYVVKPYVEFLERCIREPELIALLNDASWCLADGIALNWAAHYLYGGRHNLARLVVTLSEIIVWPRRLRRQLPDRFGGTNFTWPLLQAAATNQLKVYLIGSPRAQSIEATAQWLESHIAGLKIVGFCSGDLTPRLEDKLQAELNRLSPDIILAGLGFPLQEQLIRRLVAQTKHGVYIGEGGTFDYRDFGGQAPKAPSWMQRSGLEWLWRLLLEPSRWRRQLAIPRFVWHIYQQGRELDAQTRN